MNTDRFSVRAVVVWLGLLALIGLMGGIWLASEGKNVPDFLIGTVSACIGALGALLAKTSSDNPNDPTPPQPVQVVNQPSDPVPTTEAP